MPTVKRAPAGPRLPRFSPTRIGLYLTCPKAYFFQYHQHLRWGGPRAGYAFGGNLHRVLQHLHQQGGPEQVSLEALRGQLHETWSAAGFASAAEAAVHLEHGQAILEAYHRAAIGTGDVTLWTERTVQHRYERFVLFGKIDRLDRRADGALEVVDYKSGRLTVTEAEVRENLALMIYQLLVAREHPGVPVYTGIWCLRTGERARVLRSPEELDAAEGEVVEVVHRLLEDAALEPTPGPQCRGCPYPRICPPGRRWLATHREAPGSA
jgi:putative RecB family exonuclease